VERPLRARLLSADKQVHSPPPDPQFLPPRGSQIGTIWMPLLIQLGQRYDLRLLKRIKTFRRFQHMDVRLWV